MKKSRFIETQIVKAIKEHESGCKDNNSNSSNMNMYLINFQGQLKVYRGLDVVNDRGTFPGSNKVVTIGEFDKANTFHISKEFEGSPYPVITGWKDVIYGSSIKKKKRN